MHTSIQADKGHATSHASTQQDNACFFQPKFTANTLVQRKCTDCEQEQVQRKESAGSDSGGKSAPSIVSDVISSGGGQPMEGGTRQFMESRFGQDFGQVRIHTDSRAAESASAIQARAYTSGRDVVFGKGEYQPDSEGGKRLLAHELAHVGQQGIHKGSATFVQKQPSEGIGDDLMAPSGETETPDDARTRRIQGLLQMEPDAAAQEAINRTCPVGMASLDRFRCVAREVALAPFRRHEGSAFLRRVHSMGNLERMQLIRDSQFIEELRHVLRGTSFWTIYSTLFFYGGQIPDPFRRINVGISSGDLGVTADALSLAVTEVMHVEYFDAMKEALNIRFARHRDLPLLIRMIDTRETDAPSVTRLRHNYRSAHYETGSDGARYLNDNYRGNINASSYIIRNQMRVVVPIRFLDGEETGCSSDHLHNCHSFYPIGKSSILNRWREAITSHWNNKFTLNNGRESYQLVFVPFFAPERDDNARPVRVMSSLESSCNMDGSDPGRANSGCWFTMDTDRTIAHEFGHLIGASDEYNLPGSEGELRRLSPGMSDEDVALSNYESITGESRPENTAGYDVPNSLMASGNEVQIQHLSRLLRLINEGLSDGAPRFRLIRNSD